MVISLAPLMSSFCIFVGGFVSSFLPFLLTLNVNDDLIFKLKFIFGQSNTNIVLIFVALLASILMKFVYENKVICNQHIVIC